MARSEEDVMRRDRFDYLARKGSKPILAAIGMAALLAGCGGGTTSTSATSITGTIKVGSPQSLTGGAAFAGTKIQEGMQVATDEVNSSKFLGSATLNVNYVDVASTPQQAVTVTRQMIEQDQVSAIVGLVLSGQTPGAVAVAQSAQVPIIIIEGAAPGVSSTGDYVTQTNLQQYAYADKMGQALKKLNIATTQVLYAQDNPTITTLVHTLTDQVFPKYGIKPSLKAYVGSDTDLSAGITQGLAAKVDAIGCLFVGAQGTTCLSQARNAGFKGQLWGQAGFDGGTAVQAGAVAEGLIFTAAWSPDFTYPESKKFLQLYKAKFPSGSPTAFQAEGYDGVWLLARSIKEGNGTSRAAIHTGMLKVLGQGMNGALGPMTWDKDRVLHASGAVIQIKNGQPVLFL
jgi:branched-chain amino acid transport system substrate-binding protein